MLLDVMGPLLPSAAGIALSPFPVVAIVLVVTGPRARSAGPTFALGWLVGLGALTAVAVAVGALVGGGEPAVWLSWTRVALGAALVVMAGRKLSPALRGATSSKTPGWMAGLSAATPGRALVLGLGLAALNPKNIAFALASASIIGQAGQPTAAVFAEAAVFVLLASTTVLGVLAVGLLGGRRGAAALAPLKETLLARNDLIVGLVVLLIGTNIVGTGLSGLG